MYGLSITLTYVQTAITNNGQLLFTRGKSPFQVCLDCDSTYQARLVSPRVFWRDTGQAKYLNLDPSKLA